MPDNAEKYQELSGVQQGGVGISLNSKITCKQMKTNSNIE